jgi:N-sulfoglucosamine sulfohydrolase
MFKKMKAPRLYFSKGLILFGFLLVTSCDTEFKKEKNKGISNPPNILLLMSDNQSADHLGCYGDASVKTQNRSNCQKWGAI